MRLGEARVDELAVDKVLVCGFAFPPVFAAFRVNEFRQGIEGLRANGDRLQM